MNTYLQRLRELAVSTLCTVQALEDRGATAEDSEEWLGGEEVRHLADADEELQSLVEWIDGGRVKE